ncbi:MAG: hypothetical protein SFY95_07085 [Planctomycetota bacterium]|nr:hypothetical protein [Planctomycetota bacterium]
MRCKSCDYPLWNMRERLCPECGAGFKPSDFDFNFSAVKFCCPHCATAYYGTSARGHLDPASFTCVGCQRAITMDEMVVVPGDHVSPAMTEVATNVWEHAGDRGTLARWWRTLKDSMFRPGKLIEATPPAGVRVDEQGVQPPSESVWPALRFAMLSNLLTILVAIVPMLLILAVPMFVGAGPGGGGGAMAFPMMTGLAIGLLVAVIIFPITIGLWSLASHAMLRVTGGSAFGLGRTVQCLAYSSGTNVTAAVPCVGGYFSWIWWVVASILMIRSGQRVSGGRASAAVLVPVCVVMLTCVAGYVGFFAWAIQQGQTASANAQKALQQAQAAQKAQLEALTGTGALPALTTHARTSGDSIRVAFEGYVEEFGDYPQHVLRLVAEARLAVTDVATPGELSEPVPGTGVLLRELVDRSRDSRMAMARTVEQSLPTGVIAYRLGAFVFVHPGLSSSAVRQAPELGELWIAVCPVSVRGEQGDVVVVRALLPAMVLARDRFEQALAAQNKLRERAGLEALPGLETLEAITPEKPLVGGAMGAGGAGAGGR